MSTETTICGNATEKEKCIIAVINLGKIPNLVASLIKAKEKNAHFFNNKDGELFVKVVLIKKKEIGKFGDTHFIVPATDLEKKS